MSRCLLLSVLVAAALSAWAEPARADLWYEHYAAAEKALAEERWTEAVEELNLALEKRGDSGARVRTYGMRFTAYLPYLKLGIAYYRLGQLDTAEQAFDTEERLGAVAESEEGLRQLQEYRERVASARAEAEQRKAERVRSILAAGLEESAALEGEGRLEEAIAALGDALAVAPQDPEALAAAARLRRALARRQEELNAQERRRDLEGRARELLAEGDYSRAAGLLEEALSLGESAEVRRLLEGARRELRARLAAAERQERASIEDGLAQVRGLEEAGRLEEALRRLQDVLALEPGNAEALSLQRSLIAARGEQEEGRRRREQVEALLETVQSDREAGRIRQVLAGANRVLALEPGNEDALEALAVAFREINKELLVTVVSGVRRNFPPAIRFVDQRRERQDGSRVERVDRPDFRLNGVVIDEAPVEITFYSDDAEQPLVAEAESQAVGDLFITEFRLDHRLRPGEATFLMFATDAEGVNSGSQYTVLYRPPLHRRPVFYGALAAGLLLVAGEGWRRRRVRRRRLLQRRFNPYTAGAPILDEDLFFGRERLIDRILQTVHNNSLLLHGERRIGKTSLQHHLKRRLEALEDPEFEFYPVFVDLQGTPEDRFFATLAEEIFQELAPRLDGLRPARDPEGAYGYRDFVRDLRAVMKRLEAQSARRIRLVLLIDEVDELNSYDPKINQKLRSLFMKTFAENLVAVVSGVSIKRDWEREGSPWYNFFEEMEVAPFADEDARELVERPVKGLIRFDEGAIEKIMELSGRRPYRIQRLCMGLVNRMHEEGRTLVGVADVEAVAGAGEVPSP